MIPRKVVQYSFLLGFLVVVILFIYLYIQVQLWLEHGPIETFIVRPAVTYTCLNSLGHHKDNYPYVSPLEPATETTVTVDYLEARKYLADANNAADGDAAMYI